VAAHAVLRTLSAEWMRMFPPALAAGMQQNESAADFLDRTFAECSALPMPFRKDGSNTAEQRPRMDGTA